MSKTVSEDRSLYFEMKERKHIGNVQEYTHNIAIMELLVFNSLSIFTHLKRRANECIYVNLTFHFLPTKRIKTTN